MSLANLLALLRKRLVFIVVFTAVVFAGSCISARMLPDEYTATTTIYVLTRDIGYDFQQPSADSAASESQNQRNVYSSPVTAGDLSYSSLIGSEITGLMDSDRARNDVAERLGLPNLKGFSITNVSSNNARLITVAVMGPDSQQVADVANTLVEVASDIAVSMMNVEAVNVIDSAEPPASPSGPNRIRYATIGLLAGFLASILLVLVADLLDTRVHNVEDVKNLVSLPVLSCFPSTEDDEGDADNASKTLLANIRFMSVDNPLRTIAVTSAAPNEGKTVIAAWFARAIATSGKTVLLIESDMRRRSMAARLGVHSKSGVYSVLSGEKNLREAIAATDVPNVYFLDCEPAIPTPSDLLSSQKYMRLIAHAKSMFDYVVFDTPPIGAFVDAAVLGTRVDAILMVVRENYTLKQDVKAAIDQLGRAGCNTAGIVMNFCKPGSGGYYHYYYDYYYTSDGKQKKKGGPFRRTMFRRDSGSSGVGKLRGWSGGKDDGKSNEAYPITAQMPSVSDEFDWTV